MLRTILVFTIATFGMFYAVRHAFWALLFYLWIAYFRPQEWVWTAGPIEALKLSLVAGILVLVRTPAAGISFRFGGRESLLFLFLALAAVSTFASPHQAYATPYLVEFVKAIVITYLMSIHTNTPGKYRQVLLVIAFSLGFEGAKQGWVQLLTNPGATNSNEFPLLGDNNGVAVGMLMVVAIFIALAQTSATRWERYLHQFFAIGVAYRAISTYSRGGFLSAAVLCLVYVARSKQKVRAGLAVAVVAVGILSVLPQTFWDRMGTIQVDEDKLTENSSRSRLHFWRVARKMAEANPVLGVGFNSYNPAYNRYDFLQGAYGRGRSVHSSWFGVLGELGYTGLALYIVLIVMSVLAAREVLLRVRQGKAPPELGHYAIALQCGFAAFVVGGSFVPWQYCEMLWHFIGLSIGLRALSHAPYTVAEPVPAPAPPRPMPRGALRPLPATRPRQVVSR